MPEMDNQGLEDFVFFRQIVAPLLGGDLGGSFWTYTVLQVAHSEPAARHAVLAITSLYRRFGDQDRQPTSEPCHDGSAFALQNYNAAIRGIALKSPENLEVVLLVCTLFVCIEFLRGNVQAAISHAAHGISLLNSSQAKSETTPIFRHLSIFPRFFGASVSSFPVLADIERHADTCKGGLPEAVESLDELLSRSVRLVRMTGHSRLSALPGDRPWQLLLRDQQNLEADLDEWWTSFNVLRATGHESPSPILEMRYLVAKIWTRACLNPDEMGYDSHIDDFRRVVQIATEVRHAINVVGENKFTFSMGFCPLLYFVVLKCRHLKLRLAALSLMELLSCQREALWDYRIMSAVGVRIIEIEHDIRITPNDVRGWEALDESMQVPPKDSQRIRDNELEPDMHMSADGDTSMAQRKILFLLPRTGGGVEVRYDQINLDNGASRGK